MANLVRLDAHQVEFPHHNLSYSITPPPGNLQEGLEAYGVLREDLTLQSVSLSQRREVTRFLQQLGTTLFRILFPDDSYQRLGSQGPLLLELTRELQDYPWELLNDGTHWLALSRGVLRYVAPPEPPEPGGGISMDALRVAALSADPLAIAGDSLVAAHHERLGSRFISSVGMLLDPPDTERPDWLYRAVEHATSQSLAGTLSFSPGLLYYSGFSGQEGWYLETDDQRPHRVSQGWLAERLGAAAKEGLRVLVLNDSLGLLDSPAAAAQTQAFFRAGLPALVRIEGRQARLREQDYLRSLVHALSEGTPLVAGHLSAVRRLYRRFEESWDWSFPRLYHRALPLEGEPPIRHELPDARSTSTGSGGATSRSEEDRRFALTPPPPPFQARRRFFGRQRELSQLATALLPDPAAPSPVVSLSGAPGSGKTSLALEIARRVHHHFMQVVYFHQRDTLPSVPELTGPSPCEPPEPTPEEKLLFGLARQLGLHNLTATPDAPLAEVLAAQLSLGAPRLVIVDGLEQHPGYYGFCRALEKFPRACRVLLVSVEKPPLLAGPHFDLDALGAGELAKVFHESLVERIAGSPHKDGLMRACGRDLLAARMLWRLEAWPPTEQLEPALAQAVALEAQPAPGDAGQLLELLLQAVLAELSRDALNVLQAMCVFTYLVHLEVLSNLTELDGRRLNHALAELQWMGLVDAFDCDRYFALQLRLQAPLGRHLVTPAAYRRLRPLLSGSCQSYLAALQAGEAQGALPPAGMNHSAVAWNEPDSLAAQPAQTRRMYRIGVERINIAELALILAEEEDWRTLQRLVASAAFLQFQPGLEDMGALLNRLLLAAGLALQDGNLQATALLGLARPMLAAQRTLEAQPLLEQALRLLGDNPGWEQLAETYLLLSRCYEASQRMEAAINMLYAAEELARQLGNADRLVQAVIALVRIWRAEGEDDGDSEAFLNQTINHLERGGEVLAAARVELLLGETRSLTGRSVDAQRTFHRVLQVFREAEQPQQTYEAMLRLAEAYLLEDLPDDALDALVQARETTGARKQPALENRALTRICRSFERAGRFQEALNGYLLLKTIHEELGDRDGLRGVLDTIGGLYFQLGEQENSTRFYQESLLLRETVPQT
ncbi:MAG: AAA family ATPase [SAR324 cluster bacterium]|nr:AAA family ATPase [SAR324 cluster bacterium]